MRNIVIGLNAIELFTLKWLIVCYMNFTSILKRTQKIRVPWSQREVYVDTALAWGSKSSLWAMNDHLCIFCHLSSWCPLVCWRGCCAIACLIVDFDCTWRKKILWCGNFCFQSWKHSGILSVASATLTHICPLSLPPLCVHPLFYFVASFLSLFSFPLLLLLPHPSLPPAQGMTGEGQGRWSAVEVSEGERHSSSFSTSDLCSDTSGIGWAISL